MIAVISIFKLQSYCDTSYLRGDVNQMWILKNSKDMLEYICSRSLSSCNNIKSCDFSTLCTAIPHSKLNYKSGLLVQLCFMKRNHQCRYKYIVIERDISYFVKHHSDSIKKFSETNIFGMLDNTFAMFGGRVFQPVLFFSPTGSFFYEANFIQGLLKKNEKKLARTFNVMCSYLHDVISLNNSRFGEFVDRIYLIELEIKVNSDTYRSA